MGKYTEKEMDEMMRGFLNNLCSSYERSAAALRNTTQRMLKAQERCIDCRMLEDHPCKACQSDQILAAGALLDQLQHSQRLIENMEQLTDAGLISTGERKFDA